MYVDIEEKLRTKNSEIEDLQSTFENGRNIIYCCINLNFILYNNLRKIMA